MSINYYSICVVCALLFFTDMFTWRVECQKQSAFPFCWAVHILAQFHLVMKSWGRNIRIGKRKVNWNCIIYGEYYLFSNFYLGSTHAHLHIWLYIYSHIWYMNMHKHITQSKQLKQWKIDVWVWGAKFVVLHILQIRVRKQLMKWSHIYKYWF